MEPAVGGDKLPHPVSGPLVWCDLEMTGLDPDIDTIVELAFFVSSGDLRRVMMGPDLVIHHEDMVLENMNEWSLKAHADSGLIEKSRQSTVTMRDAEVQVLQFLGRHCRRQKAPLAGNSVHIDKAFLRKHMPELHSFLHFRIVDVSSLNEVSKRWCPGKLQLMTRKEAKHTAMQDALESFEELRFYRQHMFGIKNTQDPVVREYVQ